MNLKFYEACKQYLKLGIPIACIAFSLIACQSSEDLSQGNSVNQSPYVLNSRVSVSQAVIAVGSSSNIAFELKDNSAQLVLAASPKIYFYYAGGTSQGYFGPITNHLDGTYATTYTAITPGTANAIHVKVNDQEVIGRQALPTVLVPGGGARTITPLSGNNQFAHAGTSLPNAFSIVVKDASETPLTGVTIDWSVTMGGGNLSYTSASTDVNGVTSTVLTLGGSGGTQSAIARVRGTSLTASFSALGVTNPFSQTWLFDLSTSSSFTYDPTKIEFAAGVCRLVKVDTIDRDNTANGFGTATLYGVAWDSVANRMTLSNSGGCNGSLSNCSELNSSWTPQWSNLVAYWKMNGDWSDSKGANPGTAQNGTSFGTAKVGSSAGSFNGSSQYVSVPHSAAIDPSSAWTLLTWVKRATTGVQHDVMEKYDYVSGKGNYAMRISGDHLTGYLLNGQAASTCTGTSILSANVWYQIAVTYSQANGRLRCYVNGQLENANTSPMSPALSSSVSLKLGAQGNTPGSYFNGLMDDAAIWNTELSSSELQRIYARQSPLHSGLLTSRIFNGGSPSAVWTSLSWITSLPYFKELPGFSAGSLQNESSTDYSSLVGSGGNVGDNNLLSGLVGLWHLNESASGTAPGGKDFLDSSGNNNHALKSAGVVTGVSGKFGNAVRIQSPNYVQVPSSSSLNFSTGFSTSIWVKPNGNNAWNTIFAKEYWNTAKGWLLINDTSNGRLTLYQGGGATILSSADGIFTLNKWHHVAVTNNAGSAKIFLDGVVVASGTVNFTNSSVSLSIGARHTNDSTGYTDFFNGSMDEAAIWSRALQIKEIQQLYRRGSNRIQYQVRNCTQADCSDDSTGANWKGSDGTNQSNLSELNNNTVPLQSTGFVKSTPPSLKFSDFTNPPSSSQYFQYRAVFESDDSTAPELSSVTLSPGGYNATNPTLVTKVGVNSLALSGFTETPGSTCNGGITYNLGVGASSSSAVWYYWAPTKSADCTTLGVGGWCAADGTVVQTSGASDLSNHAASFNQSVGSGMTYVKAFLKSSGPTACELNQLKITGQN